MHGTSANTLCSTCCYSRDPSSGFHAFVRNTPLKQWHTLKTFVNTECWASRRSSSIFMLVALTWAPCAGSMFMMIACAEARASSVFAKPWKHACSEPASSPCFQAQRAWPPSQWTQSGAAATIEQAPFWEHHTSTGAWIHTPLSRTRSTVSQWHKHETVECAKKIGCIMKLLNAPKRWVALHDMFWINCWRSTISQWCRHETVDCAKKMGCITWHDSNGCPLSARV